MDEDTPQKSTLSEGFTQKAHRPSRYAEKTHAGIAFGATGRKQPDGVNDEGCEARFEFGDSDYWRLFDQLMATKAGTSESSELLTKLRSMRAS